jgi:hypothetical protein
MRSDMSSTEWLHSAGWMDTLEFDLWDIINGGNREYGRHEVTQNDIDQLHSLSQKCGCWIIYDDVNDEKAIDLKSWEIMYADRRKENKRRC